MAQDAQGRGTILVVEDDPGVRTVACGMVRDLGYKVREVDTALAALNSIDRGGPVDLVFSDVIMAGGMNGADLARELARRRPELPVLLTSGYTAALPQHHGRGPARAAQALHPARPVAGGH